MGCKVRILPSALEELDAAVSYLADYSPQAAAKLLDEWNTAVERLEEIDIEFALSRFIPLAKLGYRTFKVGSYIVLYYRDTDSDDAVIAHIFHQSRDYAGIVCDS